MLDNTDYFKMSGLYHLVRNYELNTNESEVIGIIKKIIEKDALPKSKYSRQGILHSAIIYKKKEIIKLLISTEKASTGEIERIRENHEGTDHILELIIGTNDPEIFELFINEGLTINEDDILRDQKLLNIFFMERFDMIEILISNFKNENNKVIFFEKLMKHHDDSIKRVEQSFVSNSEGCMKMISDRKELKQKTIEYFSSILKSSECSICLGSIDFDERRTLYRCNHTFHDKCITESFKYKERCPNCRKNYSIKIK